jgi:membrane-associated phospholipid phosphatase
MAGGAGQPSLPTCSNATILDRSSVQAATIPSGHVAVAVAAAGGRAARQPVCRPVPCCSLLSVVVAAAAFLGRYHYAFDCVTGAAVGGLVSAL